mmetsp:Transcript_29235/g.44216  ORF Transcript_29235/g.44216 Transcript_29235/m.44216 type:complete len:102 (+) Transcript_29235:151-456(+)
MLCTQNYVGWAIFISTAAKTTTNCDKEKPTKHLPCNKTAMMPISEVSSNKSKNSIPGTFQFLADIGRICIMIIYFTLSLAERNLDRHFAQYCHRRKRNKHH